MTLGVLSAVMMCAAFALAGRRRMAGRRTQLGALRVWTHAHLYFGGLAVLFMMYHTGGRMGRGLTATLWWTVWAEVLLGLLGLVLYKYLPRALSKLETDSQVEEDALIELRDLIAQQENSTDPLARDLAGVLPSRWRVFSSSYQPENIREDLYRRLASAHAGSNISGLKERIHRTLRVIETQASLSLYRLRRRWLVTHLGVSVMIMVIMIAHILSVIAF